MSRDRIELTLLPGVNDPLLFSNEYQAELSVVDSELRKRGLELEATSFAAHQAADGMHLGQFVVTLGPPIVAAVAGVAGAWLQARYGRKVRLKFGDPEVEARSLQEVEDLLKRVNDLQDNAHR